MDSEDSQQPAIATSTTTERLLRHGQRRGVVRAGEIEAEGFPTALLFTMRDGCERRLFTVGERLRRAALCGVQRMIRPHIEAIT